MRTQDFIEVSVYVMAVANKITLPLPSGLNYCEFGESTFLRNVSTYVPTYTALVPEFVAAVISRWAAEPGVQIPAQVGEFFYSKKSKPVLGLTQHPIKLVKSGFLGVKQAKHEAQQSPTTNAKVTNSCNSTPLHGIMASL